MFLVAMLGWESGTYLSEQVARHVAETRSGIHPDGGAAVVWRIMAEDYRVFVARYQRGSPGKIRHHERRDPTFTD